MSRLLGSVGAAVAALVAIASSASGGPSGWERVEHPTFAGSETRVFVSSLVPAEAGRPWLAVGYLVHPDGRRVPTTWTSADGERWNSATAGPSPGEPGRDRLFHSARRGDVAVAFGLTARGGRHEQPSVWRATGDGPWAHVRDADNVFAGALDTDVESVDAHASGFVAVGARIRADGREALGLWRSPDGVTWAADDDAALAAPSGVTFRGWSTASRGTTLVVAGDVVHTTAAGLDGAIWTYREGVGWTSAGAPGLTGGGNQQVADVAAHGDGFVAVGMSVFAGRVRPTAWVSRDGLRWRRSQVATAPGEGYAATLAVSGRRVYAVGELGGVHVWSSADGARWREERVPPAVAQLKDLESMDIAATANQRLVTVRPPARSSLWLESNSRWRDVMAGSTAFPPAGSILSISSLADNGSWLVAFANPWNTDPRRHLDLNTRTWLSRDGASWVRVNTDAFRLARVSDVTTLGSTFVAVGASYRNGPARATVWRSQNGYDWTATTIRTPGPALLASVAFDGTRLLALATEFENRSNRITVWSSADGHSWRRERELTRGAVGAQAICAGPDLAVAVVIRARTPQSFMTVLYERVGAGPWRDGAGVPDLVAEDCAVAGRIAVAVGQTNDNADAVFRMSGGGWGSRPGAGDLGFTTPARQLRAVLATDGGFVAVGGDVAGGQHDLGVWTSPDGFEWTLLRRPEPVFRERGVQQGTALVLRGAQLIVGGGHGSSAAIWTGPR